jgi:hypothetical protein
MTQKSAMHLFICWLFKDYEISLIPISCSKWRRIVKYGVGRARGSGPGIISGSRDNYIGVTEETHDNQINLRGFGAAMWSQLFPAAGHLCCGHKATSTNQ